MSHDKHKPHEKPEPVQPAEFSTQDDSGNHVPTPPPSPKPTLP